MPAKKKTTLRKTKTIVRKVASKKKPIKKRVISEQKTEAIMPDIMPSEQNIIHEKMDSGLEDNALYSWSAPEFLYHKKSALWHIGVYSSIAAITLIMIFSKQWFSIPVFLLITILVFQYAEVKPKNIAVTITSLGIIVGNKFYPFSEVKSFWILYNPPLKQLNLELTKRFSPIISVLIDNTDPAVIKELLSPYIMEDDTRVEDFIDRFIRFIRF